MNNSQLRQAVNEGDKQKDYRSAYWLAVKLAVFKRDAFKCRACKSEEDLRCHHSMYAGGRASWDYDLCTYETMCAKCHEEFHDKIKGHELVVEESEYLEYIAKHGVGKANFDHIHKIKNTPKKRVFKKKNKKEEVGTTKQTKQTKPVKKKRTLKQKFADADSRVMSQINYRGENKPITNKPLTAYQKALQHKRETT